MSVPHSWTLSGAALAFIEPRFRLLVLVHYDFSPVGTYDELALARLTPGGPSVVAMPVTSELSMRGGRSIWGFPKTLRAMRWRRDGRRVCFEMLKANGKVHKRWRARAWGPGVPLRLRAWTVQELNGRSVRVPVALSGRARLAFAGRRLGFLVEPFALRVEPPQSWRKPQPQSQRTGGGA